MTIKTRKSAAAGLLFNHEELELIGALMCMIRLGTGTNYAFAALSILDKLTALSTNPDPDFDFAIESYNRIAPTISVEDSFGNIDTYDGSLCTIEV
jgi:hypothetical protein